jgi:hypothetical protein
MPSLVLMMLSVHCVHRKIPPVVSIERYKIKLVYHDRLPSSLFKKEPVLEIKILIFWSESNSWNLFLYNFK